MRTVKQRWKTLALATIVVAGLGYSLGTEAAASKKNVMCVKSNTGNYFPVVRVSMMVVPDGGNTFEIVLKDGQGEANVQSISFEKHDEMIDFSLYQGQSGENATIDTSKPVFLYTNTGKYFKMKDLPTMNAKEGSDKFDVIVGNTTESNVSAVFFYRGDEANIETVVGIDAPTATAEEKLQLMTPVSSQMQISGCGDATKAIVYALDGKEVAEAPVANGVTTIQVGHLTAGVYVVRVGNKALKFTKK
jgi:hypothetical protein